VIDRAEPPYVTSSPSLGRSSLQRATTDWPHPNLSPKSNDGDVIGQAATRILMDNLVSI
jgi:hypothetical protein